MNIAVELKAIDKAITDLQELRAGYEAELQELESQRRTAYDYLRPGQLRETLRQIDNGVSLANEGVDPRLWALLNTEEMRRFRFRAPGLAPLARLRSQLIAEQQAATERAAKAERVGKYRYIGRPGKHSMDGVLLKYGDVVELSESGAEGWADRFEKL